MLARLAFAVVSAIIGGLWLFRASVAGKSGLADSTLENDVATGKTADTTAPGVSEAQPPNNDAAAGADTPGLDRSRSAAGPLRTIVLLWCAVWAAIWLTIALLRLRYPYELEWIGGAIRDHCERVLAGRPLYAQPGPDWFPFEYPPLYFWASALLMRVLHDSSFASMRLVSILSTLGCAAILGLWVRQCAPVPRGRAWAYIAPGIFLATYRFTGAWYDVERLDMLFLLFSLLGGYLLSRAMAGKSARGQAPVRLGSGQLDRPDLSDRSGRSDRADQSGRPDTPDRSGKRPVNHLPLILAALAFWLAFLTKQQAVLFLFGSCAALAWARHWRSLALFTALSAALCLGSVALLNQATQGWFGYYCFHVPLANGIKLNLAAQFFTIDLPLYAPLIAVVGVLAVGSRYSAIRNPRLRVSPAIASPLAASPASDSVFRLPIADCRLPAFSWCLMGLAGSLLSRAHWGGDQNVLMAGFIGLTLVGCIMAAQAEAAMSRVGAPLYALALLQLATLVYRPDAQIPTAANRAAAERYEAEVRKLEREGEVLCLDHGGVSTTRHFHLMGLIDVIGSEKRMPPSLTEALRAHRYAAIVTDAPLDPNGALAEFLIYYRPHSSLKIDKPWVVTGFPTPSPGREVWILRPK